MTIVLRVSVSLQEDPGDFDLAKRQNPTHPCCLLFIQSAMGGPAGQVPVDIQAAPFPPRIVFSHEAVAIIVARLSY